MSSVRDESVLRPVAQFLLIGLAGAVIVAFGLTLASRKVGENEAINDARTQTLIVAQGFVQPALSEGFLRGDTGSLAAVDRLVRRGILGRDVARVKIWASDGTILYSDEQRLIGSKYVLGADERAALTAGTVIAEVSDLTKPENRFERQDRKLLEVYLPVQVRGSDQRVLFEAYYPYANVEATGLAVWRQFAPISIGALLVLELVQLPIAWSLGRRLRNRTLERERLLRESLEASDAERRRIAADLHDGVVQDLAGVAFGLGAAARRPGVDADTALALSDAAGDVRMSVTALRSLLVEIYPPNLLAEGLVPAIEDLATRARARGLDVTVDASAWTPGATPPEAPLLYRGAQEALRNVIKHANAQSVQFVMASPENRASLDVVDDGCGFDPEAVTRHGTSGHFGLVALRDLVASVGGAVEIDSTPGSGTRVHLEVPQR